MRRLDGCRAVVTGAAGGVGSLVATRLRAAGAHVTGIDRIACDACDASIVTDLADAERMATLARTLADAPVDLLVNIAGLQYFGLAEDQDPAHVRTEYAVNLIAPAVLIAAVLPQMKARKAGQIVNIGSVLGSINYPYFATYSSSKAGLKGLTEGLRREVNGLGIHVGYIAPRAMNTGFNSADVNRFLALAGMTADDPAAVADRIVRAILDRRRQVEIGWREALLIRVNALFPRLIDAGLASQTVRARALFQ